MRQNSPHNRSISGVHSKPHRPSCPGDEPFEGLEFPPRVDDAAGDPVLAGEDAAAGVGGGVAGMDADALPLAVEGLVADDLGQPLVELGTPRDDYGVFALGDGRETGDFHFAVGVVAPRGFEGVAQVAFAAPFRHLIKAAYRVGRLLCNAVQFQDHDLI